MEETNHKSVPLDKLLESLDVTKLTPDVDTSHIVVKTREINRPGLQLTGYFDDFVYDRVMVLGKVEYNYIRHLSVERRIEVFDRIFSYHGPCMIFCRGQLPSDEIIALATKHGVPLYMTKTMTSPFMGQIITELGEFLAPEMTLHGVLVDVYGEGVLIQGESGIGKSEAALELIRRGHRLVADDVVVIKRINEKSLIGSAPSITKNFLEVRGIGIIDAKTLFGVESIKDSQKIDMVVRLEEWNKDMEFDRLGMKDEYINLLGLDIVCQVLPIRPGRNLAVIVEAAAANHRQKKMGYNAAQELYRRVQKNMEEKKAKLK
jgi:HPr kinase/phosphorylase